MPIYEYFCSDCKLKFELLRPLSQPSQNARCPRCHNDAKRVFSSFASLSKGAEESFEGEANSIGESSPCSTCSATSCATCKM